MTLTETQEGIQLNWSAPAGNASILGYQVYRSDGGPFVAIHNTTENHFVDPEGTLGNLTELGHLYYTTAFNEAGESLPSAIVGDWPRCWGFVTVPGSMGLPVGVRLNCLLPLPVAIPCLPISIERALEPVEQVFPNNPLSLRDPAC